MAIALEDFPSPPTTAGFYTGKHMASKGHSCPRCGTQVPGGGEVEEAQRKIRELQAQVEMLKDKATAAVDKCADYEDQLRIMRTAQNGLLRTDTADSNSLAPRPQSQNDGRPSTANSETAKQSRFSFLRRGSPAQAQLASTPTSQSPPDTELMEQLEKERALRAKAEEKARNVDSEIEELSVQLFSQANEMVAAERKARAKLEARVEQLEKKDKEKMARLERLEKAVARIDRVKAILGAPASAIQRKP